jgi:two-component system, OmpR family, response regulator
MTLDRPRVIYLVDDDPIYLALLEIDFLEHPEYSIRLFPSGEHCLAELNTPPDLIVLDYYLDGINPKAINGMQTLDAVKARHPDLPVIILSSQDKIEVAVNCMHHKAFDYVVKNETAFMRLHKAIDSAFRIQQIEQKLNWYMDRI